MTSWRDQPLVALDLETTSASVSEARIVEIALIRFARGVPLDRWSSTVNPGELVPEQAAAVHGLTATDLAAAPTFAEVLPEIVARLSGRLIVGHNVLGFDLPVLAAEYERAGARLVHAPAIDTLVWCRKIGPKSVGPGRHRLATIAERWGIEQPATHRALADAEVAVRLLAKLRPEMPGELEAMLRRQARFAREREENVDGYRRSLREDEPVEGVGA